MKEREYVLFPGCLIPVRAQNFEISAKKVLKELDYKLIDGKEFSCCPDPIWVKSYDYITWLSLAARNICVAENMELDILTLCSGCYNTLYTANNVLKTDKKLREKVNSVLAKIGKTYNGTIEVKHAFRDLFEEKGPQKIKEVRKRPFKDLKVATHYGCHLLRPNKTIGFEDPLFPESLDLMVEALGANSVNYQGKTWCCSAGLELLNSELSLSIIREKVRNIRSSGANCLVVVCPICFLNYELGQLLIRRKYGENYSLPILYYMELLGLSLNFSPDELGLELHKIEIPDVLT